MKAGPPESAPSLEPPTSRNTPFLSPISAVGYQFSSTLSENEKASGETCSFFSVTTWVRGFTFRQ